KRQVWVEPLFGEAKEWHQLRRFLLRGLANVTMPALLLAAGQNLKRWLAASKRGHRPATEQRAVARRLPPCPVWLRSRLRRSRDFQQAGPFVRQSVGGVGCVAVAGHPQRECSSRGWVPGRTAPLTVRSVLRGPPTAF